MYEHPKKEDIHTTGNPLLDSLPAQLSLRDFYQSVTYIPKLPENYRSLGLWSTKHCMAHIPFS